MGRYTLTPYKYEVSPTRSRYRRQNGRVPKLLLIVSSTFFADTGASLINNSEPISNYARPNSALSQLRAIQDPGIMRDFTLHLMSVHESGTNALYAHTFDYMASTGATECFNSKVFAFFHFRCIPSLYDRYRFSTVNLVQSDGVPCQVSNRFD